MNIYGGINMDTIQIILILVSVNLAVKLISNWNEFGNWQKSDKDIKLILAYLENNERDRLAIIRETIPNIEYELTEIRSNTKL
tara:strand:+ start:155 stop:403 length:249 start_codon:yes stop_codon:yes gene_type:complete